MLYNFVNHFFPLCRFIFQIEMVTPQFSTRWFYSVGHSYFSISRHHFYKYSSSHSEVKRMTRDFSGHTVYASILKKQYTQHYLLTNYHRETYNVLFAEGIVSSLQSCTKRKLKGSCHYIKICRNFKIFSSNTKFVFHILIVETILVLEI